MSTILSVYTKNAYQDFQLPAISNEDFDLGLAREIFQLKEDVTLHMESVDGDWRFKPSRR